MAVATKMASQAAISPANVLNFSGGKSVRFSTSTLRHVRPSNIFSSKFCTLTSSSRLAYMMPLCGLRGTSWNFPIYTGVDSADEAKFQKHALGAAVLVFCAKEDKNVQRVAKSNPPRMSMKERNPKCLSSSASKRIELDYFQVLKYPLVTELAMQEMLRKNTLVFVVDKLADKHSIKAAVEKMSSIKTKKINTLLMPDGGKKAYIMLRPNHNALEVAKKLGII